MEVTIRARFVPNFFRKRRAEKKSGMQRDMLGVERRELLCRRVDTDDVNAELRVKGK